MGHASTEPETCVSGDFLDCDRLRINGQQASTEPETCVSGDGRIPHLRIIR